MIQTVIFRNKIEHRKPGKSSWKGKPQKSMQKFRSFLLVLGLRQRLMTTDESTFCLQNRKNDEASYEKMLKLRREFSRAITILEMVKKREKSKRELLHLTLEVVEKRYTHKKSSHVQYLNTGLCVSVEERDKSNKT